MNESGYGDTIAMVVALAILVIFATLFAVFNIDKHNPFVLNQSTPTPQASATPTPSATTTPSSSASPGTSSQAFAQVRSFYSAYAASASTWSTYLTPQLASNINAIGNQAVFCAANAPQSFTYDPPTSGQSTASVAVHESFATGPAITLHAAVRLSDLLITNVTCP